MDLRASRRPFKRREKGNLTSVPCREKTREDRMKTTRNGNKKVSTWDLSEGPPWSWENRFLQTCLICDVGAGKELLTGVVTHRVHSGAGWDNRVRSLAFIAWLSDLGQVRKPLRF